MKVDMSPEAVTTRLKRASQLRRLCLELGGMKPVASNKKSNDDNVAADPRSSKESSERRNLGRARRP